MREARACDLPGPPAKEKIICPERDSPPKPGGNCGKLMTCIAPESPICAAVCGEVILCCNIRVIDLRDDSDLDRDSDPSRGDPPYIIVLTRGLPDITIFGPIDLRPDLGCCPIAAKSPDWDPDKAFSNSFKRRRNCEFRRVFRRVSSTNI